jgi:hypothetical protein
MLLITLGMKTQLLAARGKTGAQYRLVRQKVHSASSGMIAESRHTCEIFLCVLLTKFHERHAALSFPSFVLNVKVPYVYFARNDLRLTDYHVFAVCQFFA